MDDVRDLKKKKRNEDYKIQGEKIDNFEIGE